jgi:hypothetical protein
LPLAVLLEREVGKVRAAQSWRVSMPMGIFERSLCILLFAFAPKLLLVSISWWTAFKAVVGGGVLRQTAQLNRDVYCMGFVRNVVSFCWALEIAVSYFPNSIATLDHTIL